jgi:divalent metal cation (Fe/Co/Zn/Cd) transporter
LIAESRVTVIDAYLAAAVLAGVALNALLGWWWADPLSGLVIVVGVRKNPFLDGTPIAVHCCSIWFSR